MSVVNTNVGASIAQAALVRNERALGSAMEQLSTGRKISSAADNASGLAISSRMTAQIRGLDQAVSNANDAISMVATAEGALDEVAAMLQRIRELAVQAGTGTTSAKDRTYLNEEYKALMLEIDRIADKVSEALDEFPRARTSKDVLRNTVVCVDGDAFVAAYNFIDAEFKLGKRGRVKNYLAHTGFQPPRMLLNIFHEPRERETNPCLEMLAEVQIYLDSIKEITDSSHK